MRIFKENKNRRFILVGLALIFATVLFATAISPYDTYQERPIQLGVSGGNINDIKMPYCFGGTLGALVQDANGKYVLSNNHVLAKENKAPIGEDIIQPGLIDQSPACYKDTVDVLADLTAFKPILYKGTNKVDAAIAKVRTGKVDESGSILGIGTVNTDIIPPAVGMGVKKSGRTTGLTKGIISAVHVTVSVKYSTRIAKFVDQIIITPGDFSAGGDSGSLIVEDVDSNPRPVGLLFAGSSTYTIANPITDVLSSFGVSMVGVSSSASSTSIISSEGMAMTAQSQLPNQANNKAIEAANKVKDRHENVLFNNEGVVGTGIGLSGTVPGKVVIEVYVKKSTPEIKRMISEELEGITVEIVETGEFVAR